MKLSVIILNYNVRYFLELCLKSVSAALARIPAEIIVVDNASTDGSCEMVRRLFPAVILIENTENYGFSKGNNQGAAIAKGKFICILNPDTVVAENTFDLLLEFAENKSKLGIIGCQLIDGQGHFLPESKRNIPTPQVAAKKILGLTESYYVTALASNEIGKVEILVGAFMLLKKKIYHKVGGFDEDYFMYGDDIDLSYRVLKAGYDNFYNGKTTIIHFKGESTLKDKVYVQRFYGAMQIFYQKHFKINMFTDALIRLSVKFAPFLPGPFSNPSQRQFYTTIISKGKHIKLKSVLKGSIEIHSALKDYRSNTTYILDNHHLNFKSIIAILSKAPKNCDASFKILPKNSNFIIGSDSSKNRGTVLQF